MAELNFKIDDTVLVENNETMFHEMVDIIPQKAKIKVLV